MNARTDRIGWIGVGRMGYPLAERLVAAGFDVTIYNRTRAKAEPLAAQGARVVDAPVELADCDVVFSVVAGPADFRTVMLAENGLLTRDDAAPAMIVDCSTISAEVSDEVRAFAAGRGVDLVAAPISGNGGEVAAGRALFAVSGPPAAYEGVAPLLSVMGRGVHYLGEEDSARFVKIAHNLFLGAVVQSLVETTLLVEAHGVDRKAYLDFLNDSPMGSRFTAYKTPHLVDLDWSPTFTSTLLAKDLDLGLAAARAHGVELPVTQQVRREVQATIDAGRADDDFSVLYAVQAARRTPGVEGQADPDRLRRLATLIKLDALRMVGMEGFGYLGQALSAAEQFAVLYGRAMRPGVDRFVLSPAHYAVVMYAAAARVGLLDPAQLDAYGRDGALLEAISTERTPLVDLTCGSLGQGLSGAVGLALSAAVRGEDRTTFVFVSDGEMEEGQLWEAAMFASHHRLGGLVVLLDANASQVDGPVESVTTIEPIADKWRAFGWHVTEVDGHDVNALDEAVAAAVVVAGRPSVVIARTEIFGRLRCIPRTVDGHFINLEGGLDEAIEAELRAALEEVAADA
jgi:3-hydroxyisobutyrate dehydrogenase-like beta-hydroxyacid dehydrogenase/transketolase N-terminal domain/subunit